MLTREFKPFAANRTGKVHQTSSPEQWPHTPGTMNPEDLPTRGLSVVALERDGKDKFKRSRDVQSYDRYQNK